MGDNVFNEIKRLNFEDLLWGLYIIIGILYIVANNYQKEYVVSNDKSFEMKAGDIYILVLILVLFIYFYLFRRNYNMYQEKYMCGEARLEDLVKVVGSLLFIMGALCLLYFHGKSEENFIRVS